MTMPSDSGNKNWLRWVVIGLVAGGMALGMYFIPGNDPQKLRDKITRASAKYTSELPTVTRVEISSVTLPGPESLKVAHGRTFPIRPYAADAIVHGETNLAGADAERIAAAWRDLDFALDYSALCHYPVYGLRFYAEKKLLLETSVCWSCSNFYIGEQWMGFGAEAPSGQKLLSILDAILPYVRAQKPGAE